MDPRDAGRLPAGGWHAFLAGHDPGYPATALRGDLDALRARLVSVRDDKTTPDTRLADDPLSFSPAVVASLVNLTLGGLYPGHAASLLHARVRYFDPRSRRPGLPEGVAALVESLSDEATTLTLVNVDPIESHTVIVQAGGYGEHQFGSVTANGKETQVQDSHFAVDLAPGCGAQIAVKQRRYANPPTLACPW